MTDLEMTKLCAEAMGLKKVERVDLCFTNIEEAVAYDQFDPLHDDAQAMALVKKFQLEIEYKDDCWFVYGWDLFEASHMTDLNRAVVTCVARMHKEER